MSNLTPGSPEFAVNRNDPALLPPRMRACRTIISFLRWRFSKAPAGAFHFDEASANSPEQKGSEIYISGDTPLPGKMVNGRPAITVLGTQLQFQGIGIGDMAFHDLQTGAKARMDLIPTNIAINVLATLPATAERLAWICHDEIFTLKELIMKVDKCILHTGSKASVGAPSPAGVLIDSADQTYTVVPVYFPTFLQHTTSSLPLNKTILGGVNFNVQDR
jgi:hypothetical protein